MNFISISGHLGHDASTRESKAGRQVITFSLADQPYGKDAQGERLPAMWFDCVFFGERAVKLAPYLLKGKKVTVFGQLSVRHFEGRDGSPRTSLGVRVVDIALGGDGGTQKETREKPARKAAPAPANEPPGFLSDDDDLPF